LSSKVNYIKNIFSFPEDTQSGLSDPFSDMSLDIEELIIPWSELVLKEKIGAGVSPINYALTSCS
jgi:hypothetical protein